MNYKFLLFIVVLITLLVVQSKYIMPLAVDVASSDFFLETSDDEQNRQSSTNIMTNKAFEQCNSYIANSFFSDHTLTFPDKPINAFSLGNYQYVINADLEILPADAAAFSKKYVCRIKYLNDDDTTGLEDIDNWSIGGISGLSDD